MSEGKIIVEKKNKALYLTISNPDTLNALTVQMRHDIIDNVRAAENDSDIRVIVLRGDGDRALSSGLSMEMLDEIKTVEDRIEQWKVGKAVRDAFADSTKILVCAVKGACAGAGFEFAMCCDLVYCADNAKFVLPEFNIGLTPGCGGAISLHRHIPHNRFMEMVLLCDRMKAEEAHRWGFVNKIFPLADFDTELDAVVEKLASRAPLAVHGLKEQLKLQKTFGDEAALRMEYDLCLELMSSNDFKNAVKAFRNKETPVFNGN